MAKVRLTLPPAALANRGTPIAWHHIGRWRPGQTLLRRRVARSNSLGRAFRGPTAKSRRVRHADHLVHSMAVCSISSKLGGATEWGRSGSARLPIRLSGKARPTSLGISSGGNTQLWTSICTGSPPPQKIKEPIQRVTWSQYKQPSKQIDDSCHPCVQLVKFWILANQNIRRYPK